MYPSLVFDGIKTLFARFGEIVASLNTLNILGFVGQLELNEDEDPGLVKIKALLVAFLGILMSTFTLAAPKIRGTQVDVNEDDDGDDDEDDDDDDDDENIDKVEIYGLARRFFKPTIRVFVGSSKLSVLVSAASSLMLLLSVITEEKWRNYGVRWLAVPALILTMVEVASDAADALLVTALSVTDNPLAAFVNAAIVCLFLTLEIIMWYAIAKYFEQASTPGYEELQEDHHHEQ